MKSRKKQKKNPVVSRLNRIEGQVRGIKKLYRKDPCDYVEITQQIQAAKVALGKVAEKVLLDEARRCADRGDIEEFEKIINKTFKTI